MPISRKRFSKKSVRKNTRNHKKRTSRRKNRKNEKQFRFIGGFGEDGECSICLEPLTDNTNGEIYETNCHPIPHKFHRGCIERSCRQQVNNNIPECTCPLCRTPLNPSPITDPNAPPTHTYAVEFFIKDYLGNRRRVDIQDISFQRRNGIIDFLESEFPGINRNIYFAGDSGPYGYIVLRDNPNNVRIRTGDIDIPVRYRPYSSRDLNVNLLRIRDAVGEFQPQE
uniref:RING-type domain-containing protein n=1 Tax=viral metagenome TaxID=1070528 RepID=A0A6C0HBG7_9ZZZZ